MAGLLKIANETAYDALDSARDAVVRLCARPRTVEEMARLQGTTDLPALAKRLDRLVRNGILRKDGDSYISAAPVVFNERREGMVTFVSRFVLPNLMRMVNDANGFVLQFDLALSVDDQRKIRHGQIESLIQDLNSLSEEDPSGKKELCTVVAIGTSDVPPTGEPESRLIEMARRTSRQRLVPETADRAFYLQFDSYFAATAVDKLQSRIHATARDLKAMQEADSKPNYTVALGFCLRFEDGGV